MYHKTIIFFTIIYLNSSLIGMETKNLAIESSKELFTISLDDQKINITNVTTNKTVPFNHNCWVNITTISKSGKFIATGSGTNQARLFDRQKEQQINIFNLTSSVTAFRFSPCEKQLAIASNDKHLHIFDVTTYDKIATIKLYANVFELKFISSGNQLLTESHGDTICIFAKEENTAEQTSH